MLKIDQLCGTLGLKFPWARSPTRLAGRKPGPGRETCSHWGIDVLAALAGA